MSLLKEFKKFIMRGNVVDLAIAVTIGATFAKIITSLVNDIITPPIGLLLRGFDLRSLKWVLVIANDPQKEISIGYGNFLQASIEFAVVAVVIFIVVQVVNRIRPKEEKAAVTENEQLKVLKEIRDELKHQK